MIAREIARRVAEVRDRIARAAVRAGRDPASVRLIAVTKGVELEAMSAAAEAGVAEFGENRVQEALAKMTRAGSTAGRWTWHLIGRLQTNKVRAVVGRFAVIHSVDNPRLGEAIDAAASAAGIVQRVLVQVNLGDEPQKGGVAVSGLRSLLADLLRCPHARVDGLMTIPPAASDPEQARPYFRELRRLGGEMVRAVPGVTLAEYSMGMSGDFEAAVEEGATMVRVGSAIFGPRERAAVRGAG
jgi:hypothetical protein